MAQAHGCLFDMDGLLLDTERVGLKVFVEALGVRGIAAGEAEALYLSVIGTSSAHTWSEIERTFPSLDPAEIDAAWHAGLHREMADHVPLRPTVAATLARLAGEGVPMAVVTMTQTPRASEHLTRAGIAGYFRTILGRDRVSAPKPDPAPYLAGSKALGLPPEACAAFEDSDTGTRAAVAAGCQTWQIPDLRPPALAIPDLGQSHAETLAEAVAAAGF